MTESRSLLLIFGVAAALMIAWITVPDIFDKWLPTQPSISTTAEITEIKGGRMHRSGSLTAHVILTFRSPKGLIGSASRDLDETNCRVGDFVKAHQQGADLFLDGDQCTNLPRSLLHS